MKTDTFSRNIDKIGYASMKG